MNFIKKLSIFQKMLLAPAFVLGLFLVFFIYTYFQHSQAQEHLLYIKIKLQPTLKLANKNISLFENIENTFKNAVAAKEVDWLENIELERNELLNNFTKLEQGLFQPEVIQYIHKDFKQYFILTNKVSRAMIHGNFTEDIGVEIEEMQRFQNLITINLLQYSQDIEKSFEDTLDETNQHLTDILIIGFIIGLLGLILSVIIALRIALPIKKNLQLVVGTLDNLANAKANLDNTIDYSGYDEIGSFVRAFNTFSHKVHKDYIELAEIRKELEVEKIKAEEATKAKSIFLANMSHEIRTPMSGILGMAHLVLQTQLNEKQKNYMNKIDNSAKSLLGIINDILDFSKIEAGQLSIDKINFDLYQLIDNTVNLVEYNAHSKNLELIVHYGTDVGTNFFGDSLRIGQILINLIGNAIKFTDFGEIGLYISKVSTSRYRFEVKDTGIGLDEEQKSRLFKSFSQADGTTTRKYGGTGLGLSISKQLTKLMNGEIWIESTIGVGSSFIFEIELIEKENTKVFEKFDGKKVLLVDDNLSCHTTIESNLKTFGITVDHAYDANEAIQKVTDANAKYDLILMDWKMPEINGIEATQMLHELSEENTTPTIIMISAYKQDSIVDEASKVGIDIFLQKPVNPVLLNNTLKNVFLGKSSLQESKKDESLHNLLQETTTLKGSKILVVDDNPINQDIIIGLLEKAELEIDIASNGQEAIEMYKSSKNAYELIFMDLQMPILDGYKATQIIRSINAEVPIIALTANVMKEDIKRTQDLGMNDHLTKPIHIENLYITILKYVSKKVEMQKVSQIEYENDLPTFESLDISRGLALILGNEDLYKKILIRFTEYQKLDFNNLDDTVFARTTHTIKGESASIGALKLHTLVKILDETQDRNLVAEFHTELMKVIKEIEENIVQNQSVNSNKDKQELSKEKREELFLKLKSAVKSMQPKVYAPIILEIDMYCLSLNDELVFIQIKELIDDYEFEEVEDLLNEDFIYIR